MAHETILKYIAAVNAHDPEAIYGLMGEDFEFVDTYGNEIHGPHEMKQSWTGYFTWFPDYHIEVMDIIGDGEKAAVFGFASGAYRGRAARTNLDTYWRLPAAWRAVERGGKIRFWQVVCDSKIPFDVMDKAGRAAVPPVNPGLRDGSWAPSLDR